MAYNPNKLELYRKDIIKGMMSAFKYKSVMQVPKLEKITLNVGVGEAVKDPKALEAAINDLSLITGQKAAPTKAKKAISNFKLREGVNIGCKVTLRGQRMYDFLERFIAIACPRIRDFKGLPKNSFDGRGNYNIGVKEHIIFTEIDIDKVSKIFGMNISFITSAQNDEEATELLRQFGMPFKK
jgi:large subunit ribosomal protein L5